MANCWKIGLNYIHMVFTNDPNGELGQPVRYAFEAGDISGKVPVYHETESPMTSVATNVIQAVTTVC